LTIVATLLSKNPILSGPLSKFKEMIFLVIVILFSKSLVMAKTLCLFVLAGKKKHKNRLKDQE